jgi:nucleoid DNA-binding protein
LFETEFLENIAKDAGLSKVDAGNALNAFTNNVTGSLKKGNNG